MSQAIITQLRPEEVEALERAAARDAHGVWYPSHLIRKNGAIAGYLSICQTPIVNVWLDSKQVQARDSIQLLNTLENVLRMTGRDSYIMPCAKTSPFYANMDRLGYTAVGENVWFHKNLNQG
jgi:hypothetical protein